MLASKKVLPSFSFFFSILFLFPILAESQPTPSRVLIVYNTNTTLDGDGDGVQDSLQVAQYYAQKRGVPSQNLLGIAFSDAYNISNFPKLNNELFQPIKNKLISLGPTNIDIILMSYMTPYIYYAAPTSFNADGVISIDTILPALNYWTESNLSSSYNRTNPYFEPTPSIGTDLGRFNHATHKYSNTEMYLIGRLAGPNGVSRVLELVDQALYGERYYSLQSGYLNGNAYVDSGHTGQISNYTDQMIFDSSAVKTGSYSSYLNTDLNIASGERHVLAKGLPLKWENSGYTIGMQGSVFHDGTSAVSAPRALLYGGWYGAAGYSRNWEWLPGSIAVELISNSLAYSIYTTDFPAWGVHALADGLTAVSGVVGEPYTVGHPRPNVVLYYALQGFTFAEASTLSNPTLSWKAISLGDPLYAPFKSKTPILDTQAPKLLPGFPKIRSNEKEGNVIETFISDSPEPEAASLTVQYGTTPSLGSSVKLDAFYRRSKVTLPIANAGVLHYAKAILTDPVGNVTTSPTITFTPPPQTPYDGTPFTIPGIIPCWKFDKGGESVAYHDTQPEGNSQHRPETGVETWSNFVFYIEPGEWLEYTVDIAQAGTYTVKADVSSLQGAFHIELNGADISGELSRTEENFTGIVQKSGINLPAGKHVLRLAFDRIIRGWNGFGNLISLEFVRDGSSGPDNLPPSAPTDLKVVE